MSFAASAAQSHEAHRLNMSEAEMAAAMKLEAGKRALPAELDGQNVVRTTVASERGRIVPPNMIDEHHAHQSFDLTEFLGRLHPALVHFPIALFLAAALAEIILVLRPASGLEPTVRFLVFTGAASGIVATTLGWIAGGIRTSDRSETLGLHRWTGTSIAAAGLIAVLLIVSAKEKRGLLRLVLAAIAVALIFQGFWGAEMSLGPDHMGMKGF
ncbi:MAG: DUF2231 domain-containing protein [Parasphingorhabdus sp.]|uniref:DUF2231 domain-containing protein n=1 Tax=Parasphingorhabdus sp. TaxID=2709688 RepID=UPI00300208D3